MKLKRLVEAPTNDKEMQQVNELIKKFPKIFDKAVNDKKYFDKFLGGKIDSLKVDEALSLLNEIMQGNYDELLKPYEEKLLQIYFESKYDEFEKIRDYVNNALKSGYRVDLSKGEVVLSDSSATLFDDIVEHNIDFFDTSLGKKYKELFLSIVMQVYSQGDIDDSDIQQMFFSDDSSMLLSKVITNDDAPYRIKALLFLQNDKNISDYKLPSKQYFDSNVEIEYDGESVRFWDLSTPQIKNFLGGFSKEEEVTLYKWFAKKYKSLGGDKPKNLGEWVDYLSKVQEVIEVDSVSTKLDAIKNIVDKKDSIELMGEDEQKALLNRINNFVSYKVSGSAKLNDFIEDALKKLTSSENKKSKAQTTNKNKQANANQIQNNKQQQQSSQNGSK